jgi:hypothetical protein
MRPGRPPRGGRGLKHYPHVLRSGHAKGLCPDRAAQGVSPIFRASLVQTSASLRPFRLRCKGGRYPSPLRLATPAFARWRSACTCRVSTRTCKAGQTAAQPVLIGFRVVHVFDVSQTEGVDLPEMESSVSGEAGEFHDRLLDFLAQQSIEVVFTENIAPALGVSYGGRIAILPGQSRAEEFVTLVHETAHELLHRAERRTFTTATVRETEAEAVAFVVGQAVGLEMGTASSDYIQLYKGNAALLAESLQVIQRTSAVILGALQLDDEQFTAAN